MKKPRELKVNRLSSISHRYVEDDQLQDTPARLFRMLLRKLKIDSPVRWGVYLRDYLAWVVTEKDPNKAKIERTTKSGNIKDTYFQKPTLSFNKLLEGASIIRMREVEVILRCTTEDGEVVEVSEKIRTMTSGRANNKVEFEEGDEEPCDSQKKK